MSQAIKKQNNDTLILELTHRYNIKIGDNITILNSSKSVGLLAKSIVKPVDDQESVKHEQSTVAIVRYETSQNNTPAKTSLKPIINSSNKKKILVDIDQDEDSFDDEIKKQQDVFKQHSRKV